MAIICKACAQSSTNTEIRNIILEWDLDLYVTEFYWHQ